MNIRPIKPIQIYIINKSKGYVNKYELKLQNKNSYHFDMGENRNSLPKKIGNILSNYELRKTISKYPNPTYNKLIKRIAIEYKLKKENITIGTGSNEILERISRVYLGNNDKCIIIHPTFYRIKDASIRCTQNIVGIKLSEKNNMKITEKEIKDILEIENTKLIWICSPNNPTGVITSLKYIEKIAKSKPNTLVCVDEAYGEYVENWNKKHSSINLLNKYKNILVLRTFSKLYGLANITIGYALGDKELIKPLNQMRLEFPISTLAEKLAIFVLDNKNHFQQQAKIISKERKRIENELDKLEDIEYVSSKTSIILIRHKYLNLYEELLKKNILTANMDNCIGIKKKKWIRITVQRNKNKNNILLANLIEINNSF